MFKKVDFLGKGINTYLNGKEKIKTRLGGLFSVFLALINLSIFIYFLLEPINKTNPFTSYSEILSSSPVFERRNINYAFSILNAKVGRVKNISSKFKFKMLYFTKYS